MPDFLLPDLGEGLEDATIVSWLVGVGDEVTLNQPLCIVETAKAEVEVPSPYAGTVAALGGQAGDTVAVGALLARIGEEQRNANLVGSGPDASMDRSRRRRQRHPSAATAVHSSKPLAKPPVRKLARDRGVDLSALSPGSGPGGIVTRADVETAGDVEVLPVIGVRARIAEHMATSRSKIPDATCSVTVDCSSLLAFRDRVGEPLTPFSLLCHLTVEALLGTPMLNASFVESGPEIHLHRRVHLGIAAATPRGLVVAVVRDAQDRDAVDLANEIARLTEGARAGSLSPHDLTGSTFTVSNFGSLGIDEGIPVINHPEAGILGIGRVAPRPHVVDGELAVRPTATLTLAFDHRVCDGAEAAGFLARLRSLIE